MGVPGSSNGHVFHTWANLPISREQFAHEQEVEQEKLFPLCEPLPGAAQLLETLTARGRNVPGGGAGSLVEVALASSSKGQSYERKIVRPGTKALLELIPAQRRVLADDPRMDGARGKPAPDIFLAALQSINDSLPAGEPEISPAECVVFEDSVPGVEAGRRAGMRVVWVPHPDLKRHFTGREEEVLAGRTGLVPVEGGEAPGEINDGWAEELGRLDEFDYVKYGLEVVSADARQQ
jgi:pseudouridine 5'-phosphatase